MQKGIATLEIILVTLIISILAAAAIPNVERVLDRVALDYETKKFYTDLRFVQSFDRAAHMEDNHFNTMKDNRATLIVYPEKYIFRKISAYKDLGEHSFSRGVTASKKNNSQYWQIQFDDMGKIDPAETNHLTLTSGLGKKTYIIFDSVGRFRGSRTKPDD